MENWKDCLIKLTATIHQAIEKLDQSAFQIVMVVDEDGRLLGTVTDGDVRRGILKGVALTSSVSTVMNPKPKTALPSDNKDKILGVLKRNKIKQLPILDTNGKVVGLEVVDDLLTTSARDNVVVLMAGGMGTRLQPLTNECPKPMLKVGGKPILESVLGNFVDYGFKNFRISVNYKAEVIKDYFGDGSKWDVNIAYIDEPRRMGTAGALGLLAETPDKPFIVMNGDVLSTVNFAQLVDFHRKSKSKATMCVREYDFQVPYGVVKVHNQKITSVEEKPVHKFFVNAGIYMLDPDVLKSLPGNEETFDMPVLFQKLIDGKVNVTAFPIRESWLDVGQPADLVRAHEQT